MAQEPFIKLWWIKCKCTTLRGTSNILVSMSSDIFEEGQYVFVIDNHQYFLSYLYPPLKFSHPLYTDVKFWPVFRLKCKTCREWSKNANTATSWSPRNVCTCLWPYISSVPSLSNSAHFWEGPLDTYSHANVQYQMECPMGLFNLTFLIFIHIF